MAEWQQYLQSVFFGVVFSFLLAKLFSVIFAFREENLRITRSHQTEAEDDSKRQFDEKFASSSGRVLEENEPLLGDNEGAVKKNAVIKDHSDSDDDWEGVESTELDETFGAATAFVAAKAADRAAQKVSSELQLQLYGLYKIATEGPCSAPQPSVLKMTARAKWQAWQKLGAMPPEEAMQKYIDIVTELYPSWAASSAIKKNYLESSNAPNAGSKGPMGPVFSTFIHEEEPGCELNWMLYMHLHEKEMKRSYLSASTVVSLEPEGMMMKVHCIMLPFARAAIAKLLVEHGADIQIKDKEGNTPVDVCELSWPWMQRASNAAD
ncbi:UNVERIFIED_CONTAM: Acyl-CoA-binding domain-containing protein 1 [Sesamum calycinum]|uniref:Acyl-CoA-binding domain-containing protein 1 n=1 Tax=Sesamum calycinum TaxID=2727403 RepID=A0AAW2RSR4_9LAMI